MNSVPLHSHPASTAHGLPPAELPDLGHLSVVLITRARKAVTSSVVRQISSQLPEAELLLVLQGPDTDQGSELEHAAHNARFTVIRDPGSGAARARNFGARRASRPIILFLDDDVGLARGTVEEALSRLNRFSLAMLALHGASSSGPPVTANTRPGQFVKSMLLHETFDLVWEGALLVRRHVAIEYGFDESLGVGAGTRWGADEGPDLAIRLILNHCVVGAARDLAVEHLDNLNLSSIQMGARSWRYAMGRGSVVCRYRLTRKRLYQDLVRPAAGILVSCLRLRPADAIRYFCRCGGFGMGWLTWRCTSLVSPAQKVQLANDEPRIHHRQLNPPH